MNRRKLERRTALAQVIAARWEIVRLAPALVDGVFNFRMQEASAERMRSFFTAVQCAEPARYDRTIEGITT